MNVIHRDIKPENLLLNTTSEDAALKATDFGLSVFFKHGQRFRDVVGSAYYVAPEVWVWWLVCAAHSSHSKARQAAQRPDVHVLRSPVAYAGALCTGAEAQLWPGG